MDTDFKKLRELLIKYFNEDELRTLCFDLGIDYEDIAGDTRAGKARELVDYYERRELIPVLLNELRKARPNVAWPEPAASAGEPAVISPGPDPAIANMLAKAQEMLKGDQLVFQSTFQAVLEQIDVISDYKFLHDKLHDLQFGLYPNMVEESRRLSDDRNALFNLSRYERDLRKDIGELQDKVNEKQVREDEGEWIERLDKARKELKGGIDNFEINRIGSALDSIRQQLDTQPTNINKRLLTAVSVLNLPGLLKVVRRVYDRLKSLNPGSVQVSRFQRGIDSLAGMSAELDSLMSEHDTWQAVDAKLRAIEEYLEDDLDLFNEFWKREKRRIAPLYNGKTDEWAIELQEGDAKLEEAIKKAMTEKANQQALGGEDSDAARLAETAARNVVVVVKQSYRDYCGRAAWRFYGVDKLLRKQCENLRKIREELD